MMPNDETVKKVETLLAAKIKDVPQTERAAFWDDYLEGLGAFRVGKLVGMLVEAAEGNVRIPDPMTAGANQGFGEMSEEAAFKVATMGAP